MAAGMPQPQFSPHRYITFSGVLSPPLSTNLRLHLSTLIHQQAQHVTLLFASSGGGTDEGIALFTYFRALPYELTIHAVGPVSSMAIPLFLAVDKTHRIASKNARFLFHDYVWNLVQQNGPMDRAMIKNAELFLNDAIDWTKDVLKCQTQLTDADFQTMKLFERPMVIDADRAVTLGIVSTIAEPLIPADSQPLIVV